MTSRELVKAALAHKPTAQLPFFINFASDIYYEKLLDRYGSQQVKRDLADGILTLHQAVCLGIGNCVIDLAPPWWQWYDLPAEYAADDPPDYLPKTIGTGSYEAFVELTRYIRENYDCYILTAIWGSHFEKAYFARGIENFLADMAAYPQYSRRLLDDIIRRNLVMLENIIQLPQLDGILLGSDWGSQKSLLMSPACWDEMIAPGEQREYDLIHSADKDVWVHSCGNVEAIIGKLAKMGVNALNPLQPECMDIAAIKAREGGKIAFWGGVSTQDTLPYGSPRQVVAETGRVAGFMRENGGYILGPSQGLQSDVPYENVCALIDTAHKLREG